MSTDFPKIEEGALRLPSEERARLAERLIASLDDLTDAENEKLWLDEAERRMQAHREGRIGARSATDVLQEARGALR
jgi:putative addiction module component (TIGR02574 family)